MRAAECTVMVACLLSASISPAEELEYVRTGTRGTAATYRVENGTALPEGDLSVGLTGSYFFKRSMFSEGDDNERQRQLLTLHWVPWTDLDVFLNQRSTTNRNTATDPQASQILGDPEIGAKYSYRLNGWVSGAALASYMAMTSAQGNGLRGDAFRLTGLAAGTFTPLREVEVTLNAGYIHDETNRLFKRELDPVQRFASDIWDTDAVIGGLAVAGKFAIAESVGISPFVESYGLYGLDAKADEQPFLLTAGARIYPANDGLLELLVGGDLALSGEAQPAGFDQFPGLPPWEVFIRLTAHLLPVRPEAAAVAQARCSADADCAAGQACAEGACILVREVTKTEIQEVVRPAPTFALMGRITHQESGQPVAGARVTFAGVEASPIAVDPRTGAFRSFPLPSGEGLVQVTVEAPGFRPAQATLARGAPDQNVTQDFALVPTGKDPVGELTGIIKDAETGKAVAGRVFVPTLNVKLDADVEGKFATTVKAGRYQVLVSGAGYATQKKAIEILPADVVILNVDLVPER